MDHFLADFGLADKIPLLRRYRTINGAEINVILIRNGANTL